MELDGRAGVSVAGLIVYLPAVVIAYIVCIRHGFDRSSGWIFTLIECLVRIVGACCQLATHHSQFVDLLEATIILESTGISPLLLATRGLLSRCTDSIHQSSRMVYSTLYLRVTQLGITIALILSIVGGTNSISSTGVYKVQTTSKAGIILYIVCYIALSIMALLTLRHIFYLTSGEARIVWAVFVALPSLLVRLVYSLLVIFDHKPRYSLIPGSAVVHALMAVVEEMLVIPIYLGVEWNSVPSTVPKTPTRPFTRPLAKGIRVADASPNVLRSDRRRGPVHTWVGMAVDGAQEMRNNKSDRNDADNSSHRGHRRNGDSVLRWLTSIDTQAWVVSQERNRDRNGHWFTVSVDVAKVRFTSGSEGVV